MGIYSNGSIYGIKIYTLDFDNDLINVLFEKIYDKIMCDEEKQNVFAFYMGLNNKNEIHFKFYTECFSTYKNGLFMSWHPMSLHFFLEKFSD
jgi:hypothetical protein